MLATDNFKQFGLCRFIKNLFFTIIMDILTSQAQGTEIV